MSRLEFLQKRDLAYIFGPHHMLLFIEAKYIILEEKTTDAIF